MEATKGELRTITFASDIAQYHMMVTDIAAKGVEDVYGTFNVLMKRKPKEGLTLKQVHSSNSLLKDGGNYYFRENNNYGEEDASDFEDDSILSDYDDLSDNQVQCRKRKK